MSRMYTKQEVETEYFRLMDELGRHPSVEDVKKFGYIRSPKPFIRIFGDTWQNVKMHFGYIPTWLSYEPKKLDRADCGWLAGIIDGEGCFTMVASRQKRFYPRFTMSVRTDDELIIDNFLRIVGTDNCSTHLDKRLSEHRAGRINANPAIKISIIETAVLYHQLIPACKEYGLKSKKRFELQVFEVAVSTLWDRRIEGRYMKRLTNKEERILLICQKTLKKLKRYDVDPNLTLENFFSLI